MKKKMILLLVLCMSMLSGCAGTAVVYYSDCTDPDGAVTSESTSAAAEGSVKTGLYIGTDLTDSQDGEAKYDVTIVAVTVDDDGVIDSCLIDSIAASVLFDENGVITSDLTGEVLSKNELGEDYGMKRYGGAKYEWNEQVAALAAYASGKTIAELKNGAIDASGKAADADLASTATIYLGGYVAGIEQAVSNAQHLGARKGDDLRLASISTLDGSKGADAENAGVAQLATDVTALTLDGDTITSCYIDSIQAKVEFDTGGALTSDLDAEVLTKNQMGEAYGMKQYAGSAYEWKEQAASFAAYVTGKTAAEVAGIAVDERTAPAEADLASSVTIAIGGFQALIAKAAQK